MLLLPVGPPPAGTGAARLPAMAEGSAAEPGTVLFAHPGSACPLLAQNSPFVPFLPLKRGRAGRGWGSQRPPGSACPLSLGGNSRFVPFCP